MSAWHDKANEIIQSEAWTAYKLVNKPGQKRFKPYTISETANELVRCLRENDESGAKHIFHRIAFGFPGVA